MAYNRRETIKATAEWQRKQNYTHFGTATFEYGNNFSEEQVIKTLRYSFNAIDRTIYTHKGKRVERMVYLDATQSKGSEVRRGLAFSIRSCSNLRKLPLDFF